MVLGTLNFYEQPSYTKSDLTLTYKAPNDTWSLQAFARNLEDSIVVTTVAVGARSSVADLRSVDVRCPRHGSISETDATCADVPPVFFGTEAARHSSGVAGFLILQSSNCRPEWPCRVIKYSSCFW